MEFSVSPVGTDIERVVCRIQDEVALQSRRLGMIDLFRKSTRAVRRGVCLGILLTCVPLLSGLVVRNFILFYFLFSSRSAEHAHVLVEDVR